MSRPAAPPPQAAAAPVLVLCRQCIQYVFEGTTACPHCGGDARESGVRYRDAGYLALETMQRIDRAVERRSASPEAGPVTETRLLSLTEHTAAWRH